MQSHRNGDSFEPRNPGGADYSANRVTIAKPLDPHPASDRSSSQNLQARSVAIIATSTIAVVFGITSFNDPTNSTMPLFFILSYSSIVLALRWSIKQYDDWFNLLALICVIGFIRFLAPAIIGQYDDPRIPLFSQMGIDSQDWLKAHMLGLIGLNGFLLGWMLTPKFVNSVSSYLVRIISFEYRTKSLTQAASIGMATGVLFILIYVERNTASFVAAAGSGEFRNLAIETGAIEEGSGYFFWAGMIAISASSILTALLLRSGRGILTSLLPAIIVAATFWVLGGRFRALAPLIGAVLIILYHMGISAKGTRVMLISIVGVIIVLPYLLLAGTLYRNGLGISAFRAAANIERLADYTSVAFVQETGQVYALAGAVRIGPGELEGKAFTALLWPISDFISLPGKNTGKFIIEELTGRDFGIHPSIIGDIYLNYGLVHTPIIQIIIGFICRAFYINFRSNLLPLSIYCITAVNIVRVYFESVDKYKEVLVIFAFCIFIYKLAHYVLGAASATNEPVHQT